MPLTTGAVGTNESESTSQSVVAAVAAETGRDPLELEPLYEVLDPDALDALFQTTESGAAPGPARIEFAYAGCQVSVTGEGTVDVVQVAD